MAASETTVAAERAEAGWLHDLRTDWEHRLAETPRPTGLEEEWRRTSLDALPWAAADAAAAARTTHELPAHLAEAGVVFGDLADVAREQPELVQRYLGRGQTLRLARALLGARAGSLVGRHLPVRAARRRRRRDAGRAALTLARQPASFPVSLVVAEEGSSVALLEEIRSDDGVAAWYGGIADVRGGAGRASALRQPAAPG